jgi:hypothetical protein
MTAMARTAIEAKQDELYELAASYERLRALAFELDRVTKGKPFRIANELAWDAALSLTRTLVLDVAAWVKTLHSGWLRKNLSGASLTSLRASKGQAAKLASACSRRLHGLRRTVARALARVDAVAARRTPRA